MRRDLALSVLVLLLITICLAQRGGGGGYGGINPEVIMMDVMDGAINGAVQGAIRGAEQAVSSRQQRDDSSDFSDYKYRGIRYGQFDNHRQESFPFTQTKIQKKEEGAHIVRKLRIAEAITRSR
ncbi:unnamed protein product [Haemonchus placei]|uniref:Uncharacterized protein n=1 Tax=Haemonchus placei TaxID=6290 RepID=A0A0N4WMB5_HAEPC|nr:unnamed protein product [Haemonchus placei]